ncbi:hypothetical protein Ddye_021524 [Dipteronia dyeriana]|uniref:DUF4283 domain-containing protein n=1 Tax=Dipteronia dyeriana TaxID=168575 RepID=A0AAD9U1T1_9ROSI|nr:hypothetical protein Ddye_021524 [Dipteronia dyeriana]
MSADETVRLCSTMSLKDWEGLVRRLNEELLDDGKKKLSLCLVGKILGNKLINREVLRLVILRAWRVRKEMTMEVVTNNIFKFYFQDPEDRKRVLTGGPCIFDNYLLVLEEPTGRGDVLSMKLHRAKFWIRIHNVSLLCMTKRIGRFLGSIIGDVLDIDEGESGDFDGEYIKVNVAIDVDKLLRRCLCIDVLRDGVEFVMLLRYECLPDHCF